MAKLHVLFPIALYITLLLHAVCAQLDPGAAPADAPAGGGTLPVGRKGVPGGTAAAPSPGGDDEPLGGPAGAPSPSSDDDGLGSSKLTLPPGAFNLPAGFPMPSLGPPVGSDGLPLAPLASAGIVLPPMGSVAKELEKGMKGLGLSDLGAAFENSLKGGGLASSPASSPSSPSTDTSLASSPSSSSSVSSLASSPSSSSGSSSSSSSSSSGDSSSGGGVSSGGGSSGSSSVSSSASSSSDVATPSPAPSPSVLSASNLIPTI